MIMAQFFSRLFIAIAVLAPVTAPASAQSVLGEWMTDDKHAVVTVSMCGPKLCGRVAKVLSPTAPKFDINNSDPNKRSNPMVGTLVLWGFTNAGAVWNAGYAYDPKSGKTYDSVVSLDSPDVLRVKGCISILCISRYWNRVK
jgi:uncharacterized protein (DUF2147 family)